MVSSSNRYQSSSHNPAAPRSDSDFRRPESRDRDRHRDQEFKRPESSRRREWDSTTPSAKTLYGSSSRETGRRDTFTAGKSSVRASWDRATPRVGHSTYADTEETVVQDETYKLEQLQVDRDWYNQDEAGAIDETHNPFSGSDELWRKKEESFQKEQQKRISAKHVQRLRDTDLWETNRMLTSGVAQRDRIDLDFEDDEEVFYWVF